MDKTWLTLSEAFECIGTHLFPDGWTGDEINRDPLRLHMPAREILECNPMTEQERRDALDRHKAVYLKLLEFMYSGQVDAQIILPENHATVIRSSLWPDPQKWSWDKQGKDDPLKTPFKRFWFDIPSGLAKIHPGADAVPLRFKNTPRWHDYVGDDGRIEIDSVALQSALPKQSNKPSPRPRGRQKGAGAIDDSKSLELMKKLIDGGMSRWAAARKAAETAEGSGAEISTATRLDRKYKAQFESNQSI
jgi:hypothetical protein